MDVVLHRAHAQVQPFRDLLIREPFRHIRGHLSFSFGESAKQARALFMVEGSRLEASVHPRPQCGDTLTPRTTVALIDELRGDRQRVQCLTDPPGGDNGLSRIDQSRRILGRESAPS